MPSRPGLAAAILAGGRATRFDERNKGGLLLGDMSLLTRVLNALRPNVEYVFAVGDHHGAAAAAGLPVVQDIESGIGVLGGIYTAVVSSPCERTLVVGCDMPFLTARFVGYLTQTQTGADVVIPRDETGYQPLCAVYSRACAEPLRKRIAKGERHAAPPPGDIQVAEVRRRDLAPFDPDGLLFMNVNTPHDYEEAKRVIETGRAPV